MSHVGPNELGSKKEHSETVQVDNGKTNKENSWLFSEEAFIKLSPSRKQLTVAQDLRTRESIHDFLVKLGLSLKLEGRTILAATIYVSRFYMRFPITTSKYFVASAALGIACKLYDNYRPLDKIALVSCSIKSPHKQIDEQSESFWQWRDQLLYREELLLRHLNFELTPKLPYDIRERLLRLENADDLFTGKLDDLLKNTVSLLELLSSLPIYVAYDMKTVFASMFVYIVFEAQEKIYRDLKIPHAFFNGQLSVKLAHCYQCYEYVMKLLKYCNDQDPRVFSHKNLQRRMKNVDFDTYSSLVGP